MKLQFLQPQKDLRPFIEKIWVFESDSMLQSSNALVAPNGKHKIIIPYESTLSTQEKRGVAVCRQDDVWVIGVRDVPVRIATPPGKSGSIGIELTMTGAYHLIDAPLHNLSNSVCDATGLFGNLGAQLKQRIVNEPDPLQKVSLIQEFLLTRLKKNKRSSRLVDNAITLINSSHGVLPVREIEKRTGYSRRYLDMMFNEYLGLSPKKLAAIVRFQRYFKQMQSFDPSKSTVDIYDLYYDQSHFIREFKRFTGHTPAKYKEIDNSFGRWF